LHLGVYEEGGRDWLLRRATSSAT